MAPLLSATDVVELPPDCMEQYEMGYKSLRREMEDEAVMHIASLQMKICQDGAVQIIRTLLDKKGGSPQEIVKFLGLGKAEDDAVQKAVREAVAESAAAVADYRAGSERALNFIVGLVMRKTRGKADAGEVHRLVKAEVERA
jgi:aspartyl-tRNA(Asn)/glutamyl-tRNA(Gln) amidotransferase subunit B